MTNPREYPDVIQSAESGRPLRRGVKILTINIDGQPFAYRQPGWWASLDDPTDTEGQLTDEDNIIRAAARREARATAKHSTLTPLVIKAIREKCGLSQQEAARVFGGGAKAFEKYEAGEVAPSSSMTRLLLLAARRPDLFKKGSGVPMISKADTTLIRETVRESSVNHIYERIYNSQPGNRREAYKLPTARTLVNTSGLFVERRSQGDYAVRRPNSQRASAVLPTQREAIERARELTPKGTPLVERVRHSNRGKPDKSGESLDSRRADWSNAKRGRSAGKI
jgi:putative zinc finger/helix-turn-helix YgiT family protein